MQDTKLRNVAIIAHVDHGKTTLVDAVTRMLDVSGGTVLVDGVDVRLWDLQALRRRIGMVLQDAWLFEGTIAENIAYGRRDATREEIVAAARAACPRPTISA